MPGRSMGVHIGEPSQYLVSHIDRTTKHTHARTLQSPQEAGDALREIAVRLECPYLGTFRGGFVDTPPPSPPPKATSERPATRTTLRTHPHAHSATTGQR